MDKPLQHFDSTNNDKTDTSTGIEALSPSSSSLCAAAKSNNPNTASTATAKHHHHHHQPLKLKAWTKEWINEIRGSTFTIVLTIAIAIFTDIFAYSIVVPVVPYAFVSRMGLEAAAVQTQVAASLGVYSAGLIVGSAVFGLLADRLKRRQALMIGGLVLVLAATLVLCLTKVIWLYMVGRLLQGFSAAVVWTVGLAIIADTGEPNNLGFLMSFPGMASSLGVFLGPLIGGIVYEKSGYYSVFYVVFGVIILDIILRLFMLEKGQLNKYRHERAVQFGQMNPQQLTEEQTLYMARFIDVPPSDDAAHKAKQKELQELHGSHIKLFGKRRQIPAIISLLKYPRIINAVLLGTAIAWVPTCLDTTLPLRLTELFEYNSMQSGLVFLALAIPSIALSPIFGRIVDHYTPPRYIVSGAYLLMMAPFICMRIPDTDTTQNRVILIALVGLVGACLAAAIPPTMAEMSLAVDEIESRHPGIYGKNKGFGQGCGLFNMGYSLGTLVGPFHSGLTRERAGWNTMVLSIALLCLGVAVVSIFFTGGSLVCKRKGRVAKVTSNVAV